MQFVKRIDVAPASRLVSSSLANQTATVVVPRGDTSTETLVTFGNSVQTGRLKICKTLAPNAGALAGYGIVGSAIGSYWIVV